MGRQVGRTCRKTNSLRRDPGSGRDRWRREEQTRGQDTQVWSSAAHLYLSLDLKGEAFIPLWVSAVGDGSGPQLLPRGSRQPEGNKTVCLTHCPRTTVVEEKGEEMETEVKRTSDKSLLEQDLLSVANLFPMQRSTSLTWL